jgi:starch synthase
MKILYLAAEADPFIKVGGLADVAGSLPEALARLGHEIRVAIPFYPSIDASHLQGSSRIVVEVPNARRGPTAEIFQVRRKSVEFCLVGGAPIAAAPQVYGATVEEDAPKFIFFCQAAVAMCSMLDFRPDILHANDWHTAASVLGLDTLRRRDPTAFRIGSLLTVHNLPFMGNHAGRFLAAYGLPAFDPSPILPDWARDSLLALGLLHADVITTVSPTYAREILTPEYGLGLEGLLRARSERLFGVLNGIDLEEWNPASDAALAANFDATTLDRRAENKFSLQRTTGLSEGWEGPLLGIVSRLDFQKGIDLALPALRRWVEAGRQCVVLGSGSPELERQLTELGRARPRQMAVRIGFDAPLARRIYGGADLVLVPSRYEPCGLAQMIAMGYGAVPVVRRTGGLADTVIDVSTGEGTGFVFESADSESIERVLERAAKAYADRDFWRVLERRCMEKDFSWSRSAREYVALYERAAALRGKGEG